MRLTLSLFSILTIQLLFAQEYPNQSELQVREIMKGPDFVGHVPESVQWSLDGNEIIFFWNPERNPQPEKFTYSLKSGTINKMTPDFYQSNASYSGKKSEESPYFTHDGAIYQFDSKTKTTHLVYRGITGINHVQQWENLPFVYFKEGNQFRALCKKDGCIETIFVFKEGNKPDEQKEVDHWEQNEEELFQFIREENEEKEWQKQQSKIWNTPIPSYFYGNESVSEVQISPDGNYITFQLYTSPNSKGTHIENHISASGHTYTSNARPKVHDEDPNSRLAIYDFKRDTTYFVDFSTLTDIRKKPEYLKVYGDTEATYDKDRNIIMHSVIYNEKTRRNILDVRSYDNKDRWIVSVDLNTGSISELEHQHDEAWIGGPGISYWNMVPGNLGWLNDGKTFWFQSEETGYSHLYLYNTDSGKKEALTSGNWEVHDAQLNEAGTTFFITANKSHPGNREFYHLSLNSKELTPILTSDGNHEVHVSPDEKWLAVRYSDKTTPWEVYIAPNKSGAKMKRITHSTTEEFQRYAWYAPEVITFKASDGEDVYARLYEPEASEKNNVAVIFVHGAGYLQNAHNWWSSYFREYMFHNLLRDNGITVLDIDFRASAGYGRDHRTAIYRNMGGKDLSDQIDGRQYLIDSLGIDPNRIGIYGGSYGGFITLMALLKEPGKFQAGAALRSVTDWYHYNHEYTSNILNYPSTDSIAYTQSSPIYYANNLEDRLVMLHGMVDNNVQFQDVVRLSQRFIELGKTNWELAVFPVEGHGFVKSYSWADEYRRIYELFMDELILNQE